MGKLSANFHFHTLQLQKLHKAEKHSEGRKQSVFGSGNKIQSHDNLSGSSVLKEGKGEDFQKALLALIQEENFVMIK